ncbi:hypothetical protein [Halostella sp. PRR32]|uniref:hypothetical protein n=1 Tax=Halostella sp. PRR32 TaxID=3098147 RepID=UPI002B1E5A5E|nr:hypothetical protein [Halostella sp. PRR32]
MSEEITETEREKIDEFLSKHITSDEDKSLEDFGVEISDEQELSEEESIEKVVEQTRNIYDRGTGYLGLSLSFILAVEQLSEVDPWIRTSHSDLDWEDDILPRYEKKGEDYRTESNIDTLTLRQGDTEAGLRSKINAIGTFFHQTMNRTNFPNSPGHYTGNWEDYIGLLESCFALSQSGRREAAERIIEFGLTDLESKDYPRRDPPFSQPFLEVLKNYERSHDNEMGGLAYQALVYGYVKTEWPHLSLRASSVRTGSARQHRFGDIDGYHGPDLMISVEVKDRDITEDNVDSELGTMMKLAEKSTALSIAICREVSEDAREILEDAGVKVMTDKDLTIQLRAWDYHKQDLALQGMVHFLEHVEENPTATRRLLQFVKEIDEENSALEHLDEDT